MAYVLSGQRIGDHGMNEVLGTIAMLSESTVEPHVSCEQRLGDPLPPAGGNAGKTLLSDFLTKKLVRQQSPPNRQCGS
jgi:hypothetical protein